MKKLLLSGFTILTVMACTSLMRTTAVMYTTTDIGNGQGTNIGDVAFKNTKQGLEVTVNVHDLAPGKHGFHVHQKPSCAPLMEKGRVVLAAAAGGHYDPNNTHMHMGPDGKGHKGDLHPLHADKNGYAKTTFYLQNTKVEEFKNRSVIIHSNGDNFSDTPKPLGGGGTRIACGIIK